MELPAATSPTTFDDLRYTDRDVVLVRRGVQVDGAVSGRYTVNLSFPVAGAVPITIFRGWNRLDLTHQGTAYHFVNTHLETDESGASIQEAQAQELVEMLASVETPTFVVGDLNGTPEGGTGTYQTLVGAGFEDLWASGRGAAGEPGFTCCFDPDLQGGALFERIDFIFAKAPGAVSPRVHSVRLVGAGPFPGGVARLPTSDHAGLDANVSATDRVEQRLSVPRPKEFSGLPLDAAPGFECPGAASRVRGARYWNVTRLTLGGSSSAKWGCTT